MSRKNIKKQKTSSSTSLTEREIALITTAPQAFTAVRAEIEAITADQLVRPNVDTARAARSGLVAARNVQPLLPALGELRPFDIRPVRMLRPYSLALSHAHSLAMEDDIEVPPLPILVAEAMPLRESLLRNAELLAHYEVVSAPRVAAIRRGNGYVDLIDGLLALGRMLDELWPRVRNNIMAKREDIERAVTLSAQLQTALALHETQQAPLTRHEGRRFLRAQAFTLFYRAYRQTRRGVLFLRWEEGDAKHLVPSLHARKLRRSDTEESDESDGESLEPSQEGDDDGLAAETVLPATKVAGELVIGA